jgi:hypothetical protein
MGECGCSSGNKVFKLKAPNGWYVIEFMRGCDYCSAAPGIQIHHPESINPMSFGFDTIEDMKSISDLPTIGKGEHCISMIKCGLDPDEAKVAAIKCFTGVVVDDDSLDEIDAEWLGEDFWKNALSGSPSVILPKDKS